MDDSPARYRPYLVMLLLFTAALGGTVFLLRRPQPVTLVIVTPPPSATPRPSATSTPAVVLVDVRGAIARPGVYTLPAGSRVQDVLALAGEVLPDADTRRLNFARKLADGEQLYILTLTEASQTPPAALNLTKGERDATLTKTPAPSRTPLGKININTAPLEELDLLPGIGPALGQRIIDYRLENGPFLKAEDLKKVRGIGDVLFEQVKALVTIQ